VIRRNDMGQYYYPVNLDKEEYLYSHDYGGNGLKLMEHSYIGNDFVETVEQLLTSGNSWQKTRIVWAGDYMDDGLFVDDLSVNLHGYAHDNFDKISPKFENLSIGRYLVNHSKKEFVDKNKLEGDIHPLPLLTCSGNGRGGGDYNGADEEYVGSWAGDVISIEKEELKLFIFKKNDYKEIKPHFVEENR
jgi:hypothetical protein